MSVLLNTREQIKNASYLKTYDNGMWVNTDLFSPLSGKDFPDRDSIYFESFWNEQRDILMGNGYSVGGRRITNIHYFYLNFWKIRGLDRKTGRKGLINPRFIDIDYDYFHLIERARLEGKNIGLTKARQKGFTLKNACAIGHEFTFYPASQSVIVSGLDEYTQNAMKAVKGGLDNLANTEFYKRRYPDRADYIRAAFKKRVRTKNGYRYEVKGYLSEVYALTAKNNSQVVSSKSPSFILFEEAGVFPNVQEVYKFVKPSLYSENTKTGLAVFIGTGGEMGKGAEKLEYIFYHPEEFDLIEFDLPEWDDEVEPGVQKVGYFSSADKYKIIDQWGNSLREESHKKIMEERAAIKDLSKRYIAITQDPLTPSESFLVQTGGYFGRETTYNLNKLRAQINKDPDMRVVERGNLEWEFEEKEGIKYVSGIRFDPDEDGIFYITERPYVDPDTKQTPSLLYAAGTDSYDKDEANTSSSKLSTEIFKTFIHNGESYNLFVAGLFYRPSIQEGGSELAYEASAKLCYWYNAKNLIEWSNVLIFNWYRNHGFEYLLEERPDMLIANWIKDSSVNNKYGIDPNTKSDWLSLLSLYLGQNWYKMRDLRQIEAFIKFKLDPNYNCDITIASSLAYVNAKALIDKKKRAVRYENTAVAHVGMPDYKMENGTIIQEKWM